MQLNALAIVIVLAAFGSGCSGTENPMSPRPASVQFDSLAIVNSGGTNWLACFVTNVGPSTAYEVKVYWHFGNDGVARVSTTEPRNLDAAQSGLALTMSTDNVGWMLASGADSIRWSDSP